VCVCVCVCVCGVCLAGQDEHSKISKEVSLGVHGYVLVFSVASRVSFEKVGACAPVHVVAAVPWLPPFVRGFTMGRWRCRSSR
jgi:hypothetical protein